MKRTLLIDSDILAYKAAAVNQTTYKWDEEITSVVSDLPAAIRKVDQRIEEWVEILDTDNVIVCLTDRENWRKDVLPTYKENRKNVVKPVLLDAVKEHLAAHYPTYIRATLEADDVMGILSTHQRLGVGRKIIVSEDKDMKTIPGLLYNPDKDSKPHRITRRQADWWHMYQTLVGDTTDGYKGCPGIGHVKAVALLDEASAEAPDGSWNRVVWEKVAALYDKKGLTEEDALVQARVARILRASDYNFKTKQVNLWNPPA